MKKAIMMVMLAFSILILFGKCKKEDDQEDEMKSTFTDTRDGQTYKWVKIGDQVWMAVNLKYLPSVVGPNTGSGTSPYYYVYDYVGTDVNAAKATDNYRNYGVLYNLSAATEGSTSSRLESSSLMGCCPPGWHLPSDAEWVKLIDYVVAQGYPNDWSSIPGAGNAMKSCRQVNSPRTGNCNTSEHPRWDFDYANTHHGTDEFGFSALPGGFREPFGSFNYIGIGGYWWSATERISSSLWIRGIFYAYGDIHLDSNEDDFSFSVRCVKDDD